MKLTYKGILSFCGKRTIFASIKVNFRRTERRGQACLDYAEVRMKIYKVKLSLSIT